MKIKKICLIIRESNLDDRVRLSKTINYLTNNDYSLQLWKKKGDVQVNFITKSISKTYDNKMVEYVIWTIKLFIRLLFTRRIGVIFVSGFESALMVYLRSFFIKTEYIFDNPDNFYQSKNFSPSLRNRVLNIEKRVIERSMFTVVPDASRIGGYNLPKDKFKILKNFPSKNDLKESLKRQNTKKEKLVIYINGWLVPTRGLKMISNFINRLEEGLNLKIIIAGKKEGLDGILESKYVEYLGVVDAITSLSTYHESDLIFTFYDPSLEINRKASPNKWGDAIITKTVPVLNDGIETIPKYFPKGGYFNIKYDDYNALYDLIMNIYKDDTLLKNKKIALEKNPPYFWEDQMQNILG